jgi:hypothetical protein
MQGCKFEGRVSSNWWGISIWRQPCILQEGLIALTCTRVLQKHAFSTADVVDALGLAELKARKWHVQGSIATRYEHCPSLPALSASFKVHKLLCLSKFSLYHRLVLNMPFWQLAKLNPAYSPLLHQNETLACLASALQSCQTLEEQMHAIE